MTELEFVNKAIEGGYTREQRLTPAGHLKSIHEIVLDPNAWEAVFGKFGEWYMNEMIGFLYENKRKTVADYLETL